MSTIKRGKVEKRRKSTMSLDDKKRFAKMVHILKVSSNRFINTAISTCSAKRPTARISTSVHIKIAGSKMERPSILERNLLC